MSTFSVVRFRVKSGREAEFLNAHRDDKARWPGLIKGHIIKTGERSYCLVCEWNEGLAASAKGDPPPVR